MRYARNRNAASIKSPCACLIASAASSRSYSDPSAITRSTARLVDAQPLRDTLAAASRAHLAFIVSDEIYRGIIRHEYRFIDASTFRPVRLSLKELDTTAWVHVPGYPAPPGLPPAQTAPPPKVPEPEPPVVASTHIHGDQVFGDKFIGNKNVYGAGPA